MSVTGTHTHQHAPIAARSGMDHAVPESPRADDHRCIEQQSDGDAYTPTELLLYRWLCTDPCSALQTIKRATTHEGEAYIALRVDPAMLCQFDRAYV